MKALGNEWSEVAISKINFFTIGKPVHADQYVSPSFAIHMSSTGEKHPKAGKKTTGKTPMAGEVCYMRPVMLTLTV